MCLSLEHQNPSITSEKMGYFDRVTFSLHILYTANQETIREGVGSTSTPKYALERGILMKASHQAKILQIDQEHTWCSWLWCVSTEDVYPTLYHYKGMPFVVTATVKVRGSVSVTAGSKKQGTGSTRRQPRHGSGGLTDFHHYFGDGGYSLTPSLEIIPWIW